MNFAERPRTVLQAADQTSYTFHGSSSLAHAEREGKIEFSRPAKAESGDLLLMVVYMEAIESVAWGTLPSGWEKKVDKWSSAMGARVGLFVGIDDGSTKPSVTYSGKHQTDGFVYAIKGAQYDTASAGFASGVFGAEQTMQAVTPLAGNNLTLWGGIEDTVATTRRFPNAGILFEGEGAHLWAEYREASGEVKARQAVFSASVSGVWFTFTLKTPIRVTLTRAAETDTTLALTKTGPYQTEVLADEPILYWKLDETSGTEAADSSVKAHPGTYKNTPTLGNASALANGAGKSATFERASSEQASVADHTDFRGMTALTVEAWVKPLTTPASGEFYTLAYKGPVSGHSTWGIDYRNAAGTKQLGLYVDDGTTLGEKIFAQTLSTSAWTHLVFTWDGTNIRLYVNKVEHASSPQADGIGATANNTETNAVYLASFHEIDYFNGGIDEFAVYRKALSKARVEAHYTAGTGAAAQKVSLTVATETDAAQALTAIKTILKSLTIATETDAAQVIKAVKKLAVTFASETDAAQVLKAVKKKALTIATETDAAQALVYKKPIFKALTLVTETDAAQVVKAVKKKALTIATETDAAQALTVIKTIKKTLTLASETDAAQVVKAAKLKLLTFASETDAAQALAFTKPIKKALTVANETDAAQVVKAVKKKALSLASEVDSALTLAFVKPIKKTLSNATETDAAQVIYYRARKLFTQDFETWPLSGWSSPNMEEDTTVALHGAKSARAPVGPTQNYVGKSYTGLIGRGYYTRAALRLSSTPAATESLILAQAYSSAASAAIYQVDLYTDGQILVYSPIAGTTLLSTGYFPTANTWFYVETKLVMAAAGNSTYAVKIRNEAGTVVYESGDKTANLGNQSFSSLEWGHVFGADAAIKVNVDDIQINDAPLNEENWPGLPVASILRKLTFAAETDAAQVVKAVKKKLLTIATETDSALALTAIKVIKKALTIATETDAALALTILKPIKVSLTKAAETDSALALAAIKKKALTFATETDSALALKAAKLKSLTLANETDSARALTVVKVIFKALTLASETDAAQALKAVKKKALALATEVDSAQVLTVVKTIKKTISLVTETDAAQAIKAVKTKTLALASETDAALALTVVKVIKKTLTLASETDAAQAIRAAHLRKLSFASETDLARPLTVIKTIFKTLVAAPETDQALPANTAGSKKLVFASETDSALALVVVKVIKKAISQALETDSAQALTAAHTRTLTRAAELDSALALVKKKVLALVLASEADSARALSSAKKTPLVSATELDQSLALSHAHLAHLVRALETDIALAISIRGTSLVSLTLASETDQARPLVYAKPLHKALVQALESDAARPVVFTKPLRKTLASVIESDLALLLSHAKAAHLTPALELDSGQKLRVPQRMFLVPALETDTAELLVALQRLSIATADETDLALALERKIGITLVPATELDSARALTFAGEIGAPAVLLLEDSALGMALFDQEAWTMLVEDEAVGMVLEDESGVGSDVQDETMAMSLEDGP